MATSGVSLQPQLRQARQGVAAAAAAPVRAHGRSRRLNVSAKQTATGPTVAIVGITGAVGQEFLSVSHWLRRDVCSFARRRSELTGLLILQVISQRNFPYKDLRFLASARCAVACPYRSLQPPG